MAEGREYHETTFQFIKIVQIYGTFRLECVVRSKGGSSTDIRFRRDLSIFQHFLFFPRRLTYNRSAIALRRPCCKLPCDEIWHEFDVWAHEFANFLKFANTSLPTLVSRMKAAYLL